MAESLILHIHKDTRRQGGNRKEQSEPEDYDGVWGDYEYFTESVKGGKRITRVSTTSDENSVRIQSVTVTVIPPGILKETRFAHEGESWSKKEIVPEETVVTATVMKREASSQ